MRMTTLVPTVAMALLVCVAGGASAQGRQRPPSFITCERNHLTSFTGRVFSLTRGPDATTLQMDTDADTKERFTLRHPGADATAWFFVAGRPFTTDDWTDLAPRGRLREGARATVWVCGDEPNPKVDWMTPPASR